MVIKERKTADELDTILRKSPMLMEIMTNGCNSQLTGTWMDWFTEEYIRKVCVRTTLNPRGGDKSHHRS